MVEIADILLIPPINLLKQSIGYSSMYAVLMTAIFYVICVNLIIKIVTNHAEKKQLHEEINQIRNRIKELKGPGLLSILKIRDEKRKFQDKIKEILAFRKANGPLIIEEYKKLNKLNKKFMWNFTLKPILFYVPLVLLVPIRANFTGVINQPLMGLIGILLISIILVSYTAKRAGRTPLIEHKLQQFIVGFGGIMLLFKSSLSMLWFYLVVIFMLNIFVRKIMRTD